MFKYPVKVMSVSSISSKHHYTIQVEGIIHYNWIIYNEDLIWISFENSEVSPIYCCLRNENGDEYIELSGDN
jgi:hypothetical protein